MGSERDNELQALRRDFGQARHGFDRNQVRQYLEYVENETRQLISERDAALEQSRAASRELENARFEIGKLHARVDELNKPPERLEDLDDRMQRTARVANERAEDTVNRAQVAAEEHWQRTVEESQKLRDRYSSLLAQLESHATALHTEHEQMLEMTKAEVSELTERANNRRAQLDEQSEQQRREVEQEFDATMAAERERLDREIADRQASAKNEAEHRIAEADAEAKRLVDEAKNEANHRLGQATSEAERISNEAQAESDRLSGLHQQARERLRRAEEVLAGSEDMLTQTDGEEITLPEQASNSKHVRSTPRGDGQAAGSTS